MNVSQAFSLAASAAVLCSLTIPKTDTSKPTPTKTVSAAITPEAPAFEIRPIEDLLVAQAAKPAKDTKYIDDIEKHLEPLSEEEFENLQWDIVRKRYSGEDDDCLKETHRYNKRNLQLSTEEMTKRGLLKTTTAAAPSSPKKSAAGCDPNCQCGVTGICTCGPDCPCTCPRATGVSKATANPIVVASAPPVVMTYQNFQEPVYETRYGLFGRPWRVQVGTQTVSRPVVTSSTMGVTYSSMPQQTYVSNPSSVVTTSYPSSSVKVTTPAARSSTVIYSTPRASRCVIGPDGVKRCYP